MRERKKESLIKMKTFHDESCASVTNGVGKKEQQVSLQYWNFFGDKNTRLGDILHSEQFK